MPPTRDQWFGVELRHFAALAAIARARSLRGAADELGYVQSAISQQLAAFERAVGLRLIDRARGPGPLRLTPAGELLLGHAEEILERVNAARADLERHRTETRHTLRIGAGGGSGAALLAAILARLGTDDVVVSERLGDERVSEALLAGHLDVAIVELPPPPCPFERRWLYDAGWWLLAPEASAQARTRAAPDLDRLAALPLILPRGGRALERIEARLLRPRGFRDPVLRTDSRGVIDLMVASGRGLGLVSDRCAPVHAGTVAIELKALPAVAYGLVWHAERTGSAALDAFLAAAFAPQPQPPRAD